MMKGVLFHQDNAPAHKYVVQWLLCVTVALKLIDHLNILLIWHHLTIFCKNNTWLGSSIGPMIRSYRQLRTFSRIRMRASIPKESNFFLKQDKIHNTEEEYLKRMKTCSTKRLVPKSDQVSEKDKKMLEYSTPPVPSMQHQTRETTQFSYKWDWGWYSESLVNSSVSLNLIQLINNQLTQLKNKLFLEIRTEYHPERWSDHKKLPVECKKALECYTQWPWCAKLPTDMQEFNIPKIKATLDYERFHMRAKCEIRMIILVTDHANDGVLAGVYAN